MCYTLYVLGRMKGIIVKSKNNIVLNLDSLEEKRKPVCGGNGLFNPTILNISKETLEKIKAVSHARNKVL